MKHRFPPRSERAEQKLDPNPETNPFAPRGAPVDVGVTPRTGAAGAQDPRDLPAPPSSEQHDDGSSEKPVAPPRDPSLDPVPPNPALVNPVQDTSEPVPAPNPTPAPVPTIAPGDEASVTQTPIGHQIADAAIVPVSDAQIQSPTSAGHWPSRTEVPEGF